ncbi:activator of HSP90 ATPase [Cellvibrio zantedeschiae]|uniref:Activator of HSP90 ATPase n=1 Tax=Cellvibrio zantedeschiae TaxID=1237077 RepID=A0ABQ3B130_9GAMM|nr:SRPBCC domain-containing protein [Cellvibrio zantedeschiae]GGY73632.1 activator of HSP90 ATPase [Cellvibrio zantedeschiae]
MTTSNTFTIKRTLNAPRQLVWDAWTQAEHLGKWFSPTAFTIKVVTMDLKPNGIFHYCMTTPDGTEMWGKWMFRDINAPEKLVLIQCFSNAEGGLGSHPMAPSWPKYTHSTMTLKEIDGKTELLLEWQTYEATAEEVATFNSAFDSMTQGWGSTFENLERYLAKITQ